MQTITLPDALIERAKALTGLGSAQKAVRQVLETAAAKPAEKTKKRAEPADQGQPLTPQQCRESRLKAKASGLTIKRTAAHRKYGITEEMLWNL